MSIPERRGMVASAFPTEAEQWREKLAVNGIADVVCVQDGREALRRLEREAFDLLLADAVLPGIDGASLAARIARAPMWVHPAVILVTLRGERAPEHCVAIGRNASAAEVGEAMSRCEPAVRSAPKAISDGAAELLNRIGMPDHCGTGYLLRAVELAWMDQRLTKRLMDGLYPMVAARFGAEPRAVRRAMDHAIELAWQSGAIEAQYSVFGDTIDARRGSPTCGETIALLADKLRWEGRV